VSIQDANKVGAQGARYPALTVLLTGFQIGILPVARSHQLRGGVIKQNENFEKSQ
jgi:hypothetical protein